MKRTKERFGTSHPDDRTGVSGLRVFDGEDLGYNDRKKIEMMQQKDWIDQHRREKEDSKRMEMEEDSTYANQTLEINRMRGMLEDESTLKRKAMMKAIQEENQRLAKEKRDKEIQSRKSELDQDYQEISYSFVPYGAKNDLPPTFEDFAKTQGISPVLKKK